LLAGRWVDRRWDTEPWAQLVGTAIGLTLGFIYVFWAVKVAMRDPNAKEGERP
jgi:F0F1-type ATP synthase assembly protein I